MNKNLIMAGLAAVGLVAAPRAHAFELDFAAVGNAQAVFTGATVVSHHTNAATMTFQASTLGGAQLASKGFDFQINNTIGGEAKNSPGSAIGDYALITGVYSISHVFDSTGNVNANGVHVQSGTVTTSMGAQIVVVDHGYNAALGLNAVANRAHEFKANISFDTITLVYKKAGSKITYLADGVSSMQNFNITGATYTGREEDLVALATTGASATLGWSWNTKTLLQMTALNAGINKVSFSGNIDSPANVPDGGVTLVLLGFALSGMVLIKRQTA